MSRVRRIAKIVALTLAGVYVLLLAGLFFAQRAMVFPRPRHARATGKLVERLNVGETPALYRRAAPGKATVVFFHGNGGQLADAEWIASQLAPAGLGTFSIEYPGYAEAPGEPSEEAIMRVTQEGLEHLETKLGVPRAQVVLLGQSLGTGVAVEMASRGFGQRLILVSPYTSISDVAVHDFPFVPGMLVRDRFDSEAKAPRITMPVLEFHGTADEIIPYELGQRLSMKFPHCEFVSLAGVHHNDVIDRPEVLKRIVDFALAGEQPF